MSPNLEIGKQVPRPSIAELCYSRPQERIQVKSPALSSRLALFAVFFVVLAGQGAGYIDPGSGSYLFQIAIGFFLALMFNIKRILRFVFRRKRANERIEKEAGEPR